MKCHNTTAGAQEEFQSSENERERTGHGGEEEKQRERIIRREGGREGDKEHAEKTGRRWLTNNPHHQILLNTKAWPMTYNLTVQN